MKKHPEPLHGKKSDRKRKQKCQRSPKNQKQSGLSKKLKLSPQVTKTGGEFFIIKIRKMGKLCTKMFSTKLTMKQIKRGK